MKSKSCPASQSSDATNRLSRGIFHPLGAAFFSNGTYTETVGILNKTDVAIESFSLAGARSQYIYNFTSGDILPYPALTAQFAATVAAEIPRYVVLWNERFRPASALNYRVQPPLSYTKSTRLMQEQDGIPHEFTLSGAEWFRQNNFTALPLLLVNAVALYGYGDINIVPAVRHGPPTFLQGSRMQNALTSD